MKYLAVGVLFLLLTTDCGQNLACGNLLKTYAEQPQKLEFLECKVGTGQTILEAKYKVKGEDAKEVEDFLIRRYAIDKLEFTCCGWESANGKNGYVESAELKTINPNYVLEISMFGNAEKENSLGEIYLERNRKKVDFYVMVKIVDL